MILVTLHCSACDRSHIATRPADLRQWPHLPSRGCPFCGAAQLVVNKGVTA